MRAPPRELSVEIRPASRLDVVNVRDHPACVDELGHFPRALYWSCHTTAGFLDQHVAAHLASRRGGVVSYVQAFQTLFPPEAGYRHDALHLRGDLSDAQRSVEPRNGDAHLTFMAAGLRTCVKYVNRPREPVYFVDLDGVAGDWHRRRLTRVIGFHAEEVVARDELPVPVPRRPLGSVSLKDPRIGLYARINELVERHGITKGRIRLSLGVQEDHAALTVNENETQLMRHDLVDVLRDPFRFTAAKRRNGKSLRMTRSVNLLISDLDSPGTGRIVEGIYQCPLLIQWRESRVDRRIIGVTITRIR